MERLEISTVGNLKLITSISDSRSPNEKGVEVRHFDQLGEEIRKGSFSKIEFIPRQFGGRGLTIECVDEDKAGRYHSFSIQIGELSAMRLIEALQKVVPGVGEFSLHEFIEK
jgi:hypothetical protein